MLDKEIVKATPIAWLSTHPRGATGYGTQTNGVVKRLIKKGYNITCIAGGGSQQWSPGTTYYDKLDNELIEIPILPTMAQSNGFNVWNSYKKEFGFRLLITLWDSFIVKDYCSYNENVPGIHHIPIDTAFTPIMSDFTKHANLVLAMSKYGYLELAKAYPLNKIHYIPHGIDTALFKPLTEEKRIAAREQIGIKPDDQLILFCGANAGERKKIPTMLKIFKALISDPKYDNTYLYIFTNTGAKYPVSYPLIPMAESLGLQERLLFPKQDTFHIPWKEEQMAELFACADLYWSVSMGEGFGLPLVEAMSCAVPIFTLDHSTGPELVNSYENGWLGENIDLDIASDDPVWIPTMQSYPLGHNLKILTKLKTILANPKLLIKKGKSARHFVLNHYDWSIIIPKWESLIALELEKSLVHYELTDPLLFN